MAANFCTRCGCRLTAAARFCPQCGNPAGGEIAKAGQHLHGGGPLLERFGIGTRAKEEPEAQEQVQGVQAVALDHILSCSLMNAPLDTDSVLLEYRHKEWADYVPLSFVKNMQDMEVHFCASVFYHMDGSQSPSVRNYNRVSIPDDVDDAFFKADHHLQISIDICRKPKDYGEVDSQIRGRWTTVRAELEGGGEMRLVLMVVPLMLSGYVMKRRLQEHADEIKDWIGRTTDAEVKKDLEECLQTVRTAMERLPERFADHMRCQAFMVKDGKTQSLALIDGEQPEEKKAQPHRGIATLRTPRVTAAGGFSPRPPGARTAGMRFRPEAVLMRNRAAYRRLL